MMNYDAICRYFHVEFLSLALSPNAFSGGKICTVKLYCMNYRLSLFIFSLDCMILHHTGGGMCLTREGEAPFHVETGFPSRIHTLTQSTAQTSENTSVYYTLIHSLCLIFKNIYAKGSSPRSDLKTRPKFFSEILIFPTTEEINFNQKVGKLIFNKKEPFTKENMVRELRH